jgi:hypothetical protein
VSEIKKFAEPLERAIIMPGWSEGPEFVEPFVDAVVESGLHDPAKVDVVFLGEALAKPDKFRKLIGHGTIYGHSAFWRGGERIFHEAVLADEALPRQVIAFDSFETTGPVKLAMRAMKVAKKYGEEREEGIPEAGLLWAPREIMRHPVANTALPLHSRKFSTSRAMSRMAGFGLLQDGLAMVYNHESEFAFGSQEIIDHVNSLGAPAVAGWQPGRHNRVMFEPKKSLDEATRLVGWHQ